MPLYWPRGLNRTLIVLALASVGTASHADDAKATPGWAWDGVFKADLLSGSSVDAALGNLNLRVTGDAGALCGWSGTTLHAELLWNNGSKPNRRIGTAQGISNLEVTENAARLYATWIEHELQRSQTRLLFGLYDLNSEFYSTDASGLLIHPSFGIGIDFSQSGRNGPSIFPNLGLALRLKQPLGNGGYVLAAVIDGVPGNPAYPGRTSVRLSRGDGALLVAEAGWQEQGEDGPKPGHWGIGVWSYTQRSDRIDNSGREPNRGLYALMQGVLIEGTEARTIGFVRGGAANRRVNAVDLALDFGVLSERPLGKDGPAAFTAGVATARFGRAHRAAQAAAGSTMATHETAFEVGARWQPLQALAMQPLLMRVWNTSGRAGRHATIVGLRLEWALGPASP